MRGLRALALTALVVGCGYNVHVGDHDAGILPDAGGCSADSDCTSGNHCVCGRCLSLDLVAPACNPPCEMASHGDYCDSPGASCSIGECGSRRVCDGGIWRDSMGACDAGPPVDAGWCECPMPPPGCRYVGVPCPCSEIVCEPERCGRAVCETGTFCCNPSCNLCVPPGGSCTDLACPADCSPSDARGVGACELDHGWAWNGMECAPITGCSCEGTECGALFGSPEECRAAFAACGGSTCGTIAGLTCNPVTEWCDYEPEPHYCGGADEGGTCRPRPEACPPVFYEVCGCDGVTYPSPCDANAGGTDVAWEGRCDDCDADEARSSGMCASIFGYAWTGTECTAISCSCEGADCMRVAGRSEGECYRQHSACAVPLGP